MSEDRLVKFETPWTERLSNWSKFKPFASWYHTNKGSLWRFGGNPRFRLKLFRLNTVPMGFKQMLGKNVRDPQGINKNAVITAVYVPLGNESNAKVALHRLGYGKVKREKTFLWKARV